MRMRAHTGRPVPPSRGVWPHMRAAAAPPSGGVWPHVRAAAAPPLPPGPDLLPRARCGGRFDTACRVYSSLIGNMATDGASAAKYYYFVRYSRCNVRAPPPRISTRFAPPDLLPNGVNLQAYGPLRVPHRAGVRAADATKHGAPLC